MHFSNIQYFARFLTTKERKLQETLPDHFQSVCGQKTLSTNCFFISERSLQQSSIQFHCLKCFAGQSGENVVCTVLLEFESFSTRMNGFLLQKAFQNYCTTKDKLKKQSGCSCSTVLCQCGEKASEILDI